MQIRYDGPSDYVFVGPYGRHSKGEVREYPNDFGEELLATSKRQRFVALDSEPPTEDREFVEPDDPVVPVTPIEPEPNNDQPSEDGSRPATTDSGSLTEDGGSVESVDSVDSVGSVDSVNETDRTDGTDRTDRIDQKLEDKTVPELLKMLKDKKIEVRPKMRKAELIRLLTE